MKIYNLGALNIDYVYQMPHFVLPGETISSLELNTFPGGKGLNQSVALGKAGANVVHGGFANKNDTWLVDMLRDSNVDVSYIGATDIPSGHAIIQVDPSGQNNIILFAGANHCFTPEYVEEVLKDAEPGDIVLLQNEINDLQTIFEIAHRKELQIAFNPSPFVEKLKELPLEYVSWWICNELEGQEFSGKSEPQEILDTMFELYPNSNIVLTLGSEGCLFKNATTQLFQPAQKVKAVDTTAAGDTFTGFFLSMIANGKEPAEALQIATNASAIAVTREGAASSIPFLKEVL